MPLRENEPVHYRPKDGGSRKTKGDWRAEYWAYIRHETTPDGIVGEPVHRWRAYNRPHYHIHSGDRYDMEYLMRNLRAAHLDNTRRFPGIDVKQFTLRMRNVRTGDIIMADVL